VLVIGKINRLINIWNHSDSKGCATLNCPDHEYITTLEGILVLFPGWKNDAAKDKNPWAFSQLRSIMIYVGLCLG